MAWVALTGEQKKRLRDALVTVYTDEDTFDELLLVVRNMSLDKLSASKSRYPARVRKVLDAAEGDGWILDIIKQALKDAAGEPALQQLEAELKTLAPTPVNDPFAMCTLSGGHILINRASLRTALQKLYRGDKRILVVKDHATLAQAQKRIKTGKSHSLQLISFVQQVTGAFQIAPIDLEELRRAVPSNEQIMPEYLAKSICSLMGCKQIVQSKPDDEQWARWTLDFCDDFETAAKAAGKVWIVIDSFHVVLLPKETMNLLKGIATRINGTLPNLRMVLLGYSDPFQPEVLPTVTEEVVKLIDEGELMDFFTRAYREKAIPFSAQRVASTVLEVMRGVDATQPDFVTRVTSLALAELDKP